MKLAVFEVYHQFHFEVIEKLVQRGFQITYYISGEPESFYGDQNKIRELREKYLFNVENNSSKNFLYPKEIIKLNDTPYHLTNDLLKSYSDIEVLFLKVSDRLATIPTSVHSRRKHYHTILNHFINIIKTHDFDGVLCFDTPHSLHGTTLYKLLQREEIKTVRIEHHYFANYSLILDTPTTPDIPSDYLKNYTTEELFNTIPSDLQSGLTLDNKFMEEAIAKEGKRNITTSFAGQLKLLRQFSFKYFSNIAIGIFPFIYKKHLRHFTGLNEINSEFKYRLTINKRVIDLYKLNRYYIKVSETPDMDCKYIYFGLHMQPEKTTLPMGRQMDHHLTSIMILSQSLPKDWKLYVKEHPNQFNLRKVANANFRDKTFYDAIKNLPNTVLVAPEIKSRDLIKKAQITSTTTGTVGWESVLGGKKVIVFGDAYYRACRAVRTIDSVETCQQAIKELKDMSKEEVYKELIRYVSYYYNNGYLVKSKNWESILSYSDTPREEMIENMATSIFKKFSQ